MMNILSVIPLTTISKIVKGVSIENKMAAYSRPFMIFSKEFFANVMRSSSIKN